MRGIAKFIANHTNDHVLIDDSKTWYSIELSSLEILKRILCLPT
ncbi:hypothetical protein THIOSC15_1920015 [uncultured Thiomicrorhabdus sp.]